MPASSLHAAAAPAIVYSASAPQYDHDVVVLFENAAWQQPLFDVLDARGVNYGRIDLKSGAFATNSIDDLPRAKVYFNQASPSAYVRGRDRVVPFTLALLRNLQIRGARVLNGADVFAFELSKSAQAATMQALGIDHPRTVVFNDIDALAARVARAGGARSSGGGGGSGGLPFSFPAMLKPEQGGSGARMHKVESLGGLRALLRDRPELWEPDKLLLLQEFCPHDPAAGVVRLEYVGGELLYAMRVVTHGRYNLCPSEACNPAAGAGEGGSACAFVPGARARRRQQQQQQQQQQQLQLQKPVEFYPLHDVPADALRDAARIVAAARMDVAGVEYLEMPNGRRVFYDVNANSNLRRPIGEAFGFDPFERVADFLAREVARVEGATVVVAGTADTAATASAANTSNSAAVASAAATSATHNSTRNNVNADDIAPPSPPAAAVRETAGRKAVPMAGMAGTPEHAPTAQAAATTAGDDARP